MTIERDNDAMDELVSKTYRDHSNEQVPDALNQRVLKMAADKARPSGVLATLFDTWTKPLAWAATIGLSLAIVLEVTQVVDGPLSIEAPAVESPAVESVQDQFKPTNSSQFDDARNQARLRTGPSNVDTDLAKVEQQEPLEQLSSEKELLEQKPSRQDLPTLSAPDPQPVSRSNFATVVAEPEVLAEGQSDDIASAGIRSRDPRASDSTTFEAKKKGFADSAACDETSRETASKWLLCIEELRLAGASEDAKREYDEYLLRFPTK